MTVMRKLVGLLVDGCDWSRVMLGRWLRRLASRIDGGPR